MQVSSQNSGEQQDSGSWREVGHHGVHRRGPPLAMSQKGRQRRFRPATGAPLRSFRLVGAPRYPEGTLVSNKETSGIRPRRLNVHITEWMTATAGRHPLGVSGVDHTGIAGAIEVLKRAVQHKCDGFDPAMRMPRENVPGHPILGHKQKWIAETWISLLMRRRPRCPATGPASNSGFAISATSRDSNGVIASMTKR